jgi:hypothetical protein
MSKSDPTKHPEFQNVIRHFLNTLPKPHKPLGKKAKSAEKQKPVSAKPKSA